MTLLFGPQASLTVLTTLGFAGSAYALFYVLRRWQVSAGAAALAGAVYGFSPALVHSALGHYNLQFAVLPPLIIDAGLALAAGQAAGGQGFQDGARAGAGDGHGMASGLACCSRRNCSSARRSR